MKKLFILLIIPLLLLQIGSKSLILIHFLINREEIAATLCVQKEVENNCCQGSCHLNKQLEEQEKNETPDTRVERNDEIIWYGQWYTISAAALGEKLLKALPFFDFTFKPQKGYLLGLLRPPGLTDFL